MVGHLDFSDLFSKAVLFIGHGGQNSLMQCMKHGVPVIAFPGGVGEQSFNGESIAELNAGTVLENHHFKPDFRSDCAMRIINDKSCYENFRNVCEMISPYGGPYEIVKCVAAPLEDGKGEPRTIPSMQDR